MLHAAHMIICKCTGIICANEHSSDIYPVIMDTLNTYVQDFTPWQDLIAFAN